MTGKTAGPPALNAANIRLVHVCNVCEEHKLTEFKLLLELLLLLVLLLLQTFKQGARVVLLLWDLCRHTHTHTH